MTGHDVGRLINPAYYYYYEDNFVYEALQHLYYAVHRLQVQILLSLTVSHVFVEHEFCWQIVNPDFLAKSKM